MATISQILNYRWQDPADHPRTLGEPDNYEQLTWGGTSPKPSEAEIRSHSAAVDAEMAEDAARARKNDAFTDQRRAGARGEDMLWGFDALTGIIRAIFQELPFNTRQTIQTNHPQRVERFLRMEQKVNDALSE